MTKRLLLLLTVSLLATCCQPEPDPKPADVESPQTSRVEIVETPAVTAPAKVPAETPAVAAPAKVDIWKKVEIDLTKLDENGLIGPATGKRTLAYEFLIPKTAACIAAVKAIDPSIRFMRNSRGRLGARADQCLCIGETQKGYRQTLQRLAKLDYVTRIIECHFE